MDDPFDRWEDELHDAENDRVHGLMHDFRALEPPGNAGNGQLEWIVEEP